ncbi:O-antigen ligase family protein [Vibrio paucivorans]|uniref:O-antigen ligase family protein n=1 Tax=Vibrio paucivorans TaxID=2829489 RepID=A0A9X3CDG2_9VIBR|nr:O-antigen ligase family protein [Vibrio paucivorans]MCW8333615.1 O-antigen ligase family protein [Vibrio paucivorans]
MHTYQRLILSDTYDRLMFLICVAYCALAMPMLEVSGLLKNLILLGSLPLLVLKLRDKEDDKRILWLFLAGILIQIISWLSAFFSIPDNVASHPNIKPLTSLFLFAFISLWVQGNRSRQLILLGTYILSFIATAIFDNEINSSFSRALSGIRVDFGMHNAQYTTMMSAVIIMLCGYFAYTVRDSKARHWLYIPIAATLSFAFFTLLVSQTRQVWAALILTLLALPLLLPNRVTRKKLAVFYTVILVSISSLAMSDIVQKRASQKDIDTVVKVVTFDWENIPMTSFGVRFNSWLEAKNWIVESPILGASDKAIHLVTKTSEKFQSNERTKGFGHLHNYYFETLVAYGLVGLFFLGLLYREIILNVKNRNNSIDFYFLLVFLFFWLIINNFESYNNKYYGIYTHNIILGCLYMFAKPSLSSPVQK